MAKKTVDPLTWNQVIVKPDGTATDQFLRQFNIQRESWLEIASLYAIEFIAGVGLVGGGVLGDLEDITFNLEDTAVTPGTYGAAPSAGSFKLPHFTVDQQGRLTDAGESTIDVFLDIVLFVQSTMSNGELVLRIEATRDFTLPASLTGSQASAGVASSGNVSFDIKKNGSSIGSVNFNTSASGTFTFTTATSFTAGDLLEIVAPATADGTLADVSISLKGTR